MREKGKRKTIAYFSPFIGQQINFSRFLGIADQAKQEGINLYCFVTNYFNDPAGFDKQANVLIDFVSPEHFDGLIVGNIIREDVSKSQDAKALFQSLTLPFVTVRETADKVPFIPIDNYEAMSEMMRHVIGVHNRRKIVFIRGPELHPFAEQRYQAYRDVLREQGIAFDENLVPPPIDWWRCNFRLLLDERKLIPGKDFDAVVCAGDVHALEIMGILQALGVRIPQEVAITGFNNLVECSVVTPTLTSVELNFYEKGKMACEMIHSILKGEKRESPFSLSSKIIIRESCGCIDSDILEVSVDDRQSHDLAGGQKNGGIGAVFIRIFGRIGVEEKAAARLAESFRHDIEAETPGNECIALFHELVGKAAREHAPLDGWHIGLTGLRRELVGRMTDCRALARAEMIFHQMRLYIAKTMLHLEKNLTLEEAKTADAIRKFGRALICTFNIQEMMNELPKWLKQFSITGCYIALYENPAAPADYSRLILAYRDGDRLPLADSGYLFPSRRIVPEQFLPYDRPISIIVSALFFRDRQIGYMCFEHSRRDTVVYELVKEQVINALQIALSIRELEHAHEHLSWQAKELERSNQELAQFAYVASHDLQEPLRKITTMAGRIRELDNKDFDPRVLDFLSRMNNAAERMQKLINDLLEYSRVTTKPRPFEHVDLSEVCRQVAGDLELRIRQTQATVKIGSLPAIDAEPVQMRQLFQNLIGNAVKFRKPDAAPLITIEMVSCQDGVCELRVSDNGIGIPDEHHTRIFGLFERLHSRAEYEGSGIGLSICKKIIEHHRGRIKVESTQGKGTTFIIHLPMKQTESGK